MEAKKTNKIVIVASVIITLVLIGVFAKNDKGEDMPLTFREKLDFYESDINGAVHDAVKQMLSFPEEASFENEEKLRIVDESKNEAATAGDVISKNAFGVKVRFTYAASVWLEQNSVRAKVVYFK